MDGYLVSQPNLSVNRIYCLVTWYNSTTDVCMSVHSPVPLVSQNVFMTNILNAYTRYLELQFELHDVNKQVNHS